MRYIKNGEMEFMLNDDGEQVVFEPETGDTHFLNETAAAFIEKLDTGDFKAVLSALAEEYGVQPDEIETDVKELVTELLAKKIISELVQ